MATAVRQPFGELSNSRVQQLASAKNRQNGFIAKSSPLSGKPMTQSITPVKVTGKRSYTPSIYEDVDSENIDPSTFSPSKKSKSSDVSEKPLHFSLAPASSTFSAPPPASTPTRFSTPRQANVSSPRAPLTAPAGRSPGRKIASISKSRRSSAPFTRVDPPFASRGSSTLPFSLDAALNSTLATTTPAPSKVPSASIAMPSSWAFEIYEDSPDDEAATLMEHSTLVLDLSSDDEATKAKRNDRGKENTPPEGYEPAQASRSSSPSDLILPTPSRVKKTEIVRRKVVEMDDGNRSPLSDLDTEDFVPEGLDKDAYVIVNASPEKPTSDVQDLFAISSSKSNTTDTSAIEKVVNNAAAKVMKHANKASKQDDVFIFEDDAQDQKPSKIAEEQNVPVQRILQSGVNERTDSLVNQLA